MGRFRKSRGTCVSPKPTVLEGGLGHCKVSLSMLSSKSTRFNWVHSLHRVSSPGSDHRVWTGTLFGFPNHQLLLSLLVLEEIGKCVFNHWLLSLRQVCWWTEVKVSSVVGIPPFYSSFSLDSWSGGCGKLWGQGTLNFLSGAITGELY